MTTVIAFAFFNKIVITQRGAHFVTAAVIAHLLSRWAPPHTGSKNVDAGSGLITHSAIAEY